MVDVVLLPRSHDEVRAILDLAAAQTVGGGAVRRRTSVVDGVDVTDRLTVGWPLADEHGAASGSGVRGVLVQAASPARNWSGGCRPKGFHGGHLPQSWSVPRSVAYAATRSSGQASTGTAVRMPRSPDCGWRPRGDFLLGKAHRRPPALICNRSSWAAKGLSASSRRSGFAGTAAAGEEGVRRMLFFHVRCRGAGVSATGSGPGQRRRDALVDADESAVNRGQRAVGAEATGLRPVPGLAQGGRRMPGDPRVGGPGRRGHCSAGPRTRCSAGSVAWGWAASVGRSWEKSRFAGPYLRDDLLDAGYLVETFETANEWSQLKATYDAVHAACVGARPVLDRHPPVTSIPPAPASTSP